MEDGSADAAIPTTGRDLTHATSRVELLSRYSALGTARCISAIAVIESSTVTRLWFWARPPSQLSKRTKSTAGCRSEDSRAPTHPTRLVRVAGRWRLYVSFVGPRLRRRLVGSVNPSPKTRYSRFFSFIEYSVSNASASSRLKARSLGVKSVFNRGFRPSML